VVVQLVGDLDLAPRAQPHVGDVGLPALVGEVRHEADVGAFGSLVRLGGDEAPAT
jgi:hypothetical protein